MRPLAPRQRQLLEFIDSTCRRTGVGPSFSEMADALKVKVPTIQEMVTRLLELGYIEEMGEAGDHRRLRPAREARMLLHAPELARVVAKLADADSVAQLRAVRELARDLLRRIEM